MLRIFSVFAVVALLASCVRLPTASGFPEVTIPKSQRSAFIATLTNELLTERWSIADQGPDFVVFEQIAGETLQMMFNGRAMRPRTRLNFVETAGMVRVVANLTVQTRGFLGGQSEEQVLPTKIYIIWQERLKRAAGQ